ncbi:hypothetical protein [Haliangium ochraceum]|nr:hypothetical protein [Haliangium ochraceum]
MAPAAWDDACAHSGAVPLSAEGRAAAGNLEYSLRGLCSLPSSAPGLDELMRTLVVALVEKGAMQPAASLVAHMLMRFPLRAPVLRSVSDLVVMAACERELAAVFDEIGSALRRHYEFTPAQLSDWGQRLARGCRRQGHIRAGAFLDRVWAVRLVH